MRWGKNWTGEKEWKTKVPFPVCMFEMFSYFWIGRFFCSPPFCGFRRRVEQEERNVKERNGQKSTKLIQFPSHTHFLHFSTFFSSLSLCSIPSLSYSIFSSVSRPPFSGLPLPEMQVYIYFFIFRSSLSTDPLLFSVVCATDVWERV